MAQKQILPQVTPQILSAWDKKYVWHPFTQQALWEKEKILIVDSGKGAFIRDVSGKRYFDGVSSLWLNLFGHRHPALDRAFKRQLGKIAHSTFLGLSHRPGIELARDLIRIAPRNLSRVFYSDNGATSVEIALKMAYQYWVEKDGRGDSRGGGRSAKPRPAAKRTEFLALKNSYHGDTVGAVSVGGIDTFHGKYRPLLFKTRFAMSPYCFRCPFNKEKARHRHRLGEKINFVPKPGDFREETGCRWECLGSVRKILQERASHIAGAIIEPIVQGAAGMIVMPPGYLAGFARLCRNYGVLLIADEVATGFCRTGSLFATDQEKAEPNLMCIAKALTGGYTPLAATLTEEKIYRAFRGPVQKLRTFFHGHSYTAHPLGAAVARANLELIRKSKLLEKSRQKAHLMKDELEELKLLPAVGSVRQAGLMIGVELVKNKAANAPYPAHLRMGARVCKGLLSEGIWLRPLGDVIVLMPPPIAADSDLRRMIRSLKKVILHECQT